MDLIGGYLLVVMALFVANIALMLGNYNLGNLKVIILSLICSAITFAIMNASSLLNGQLSFLSDYFSYLFLAITIIIFVSIVYYIRRDDFKIPFYAISLAFVISTALLSSQANLDFLSMALYSLLVFIILFVVYQLTKLLHHAKRQYPVVMGEYMSLFSILMFIFALTYNSTKALDYSMFSPFFFFFPTYQLIYVIICIIVVLVVGVLINDTRGK